MKQVLIRYKKENTPETTYLRDKGHSHNIINETGSRSILWTVLPALYLDGIFGKAMIALYCLILIYAIVYVNSLWSDESQHGAKATVSDFISRDISVSYSIYGKA